MNLLSYFNFKMPKSFEVFLEEQLKNTIAQLNLTSARNSETTDSTRLIPILTEKRSETVTSPIPSSFAAINEKEILNSSNNNDNETGSLKSPSTSFQIISSEKSSPENSDDEFLSFYDNNDENDNTQYDIDETLNKNNSNEKHPQEDFNEIQEVTDNNHHQENVKNEDGNVVKKENEIKELLNNGNINEKVANSTESKTEIIPEITLRCQPNKNTKRINEIFLYECENIVKEKEEDNDRILEEFPHFTYYGLKKDLPKQESHISSVASSNGSIGKTSSQQLTGTNWEETDPFLPFEHKPRKDMSPWVTDLFYLNFPGYYEEERRRERDFLFREECRKNFEEQSGKSVNKRGHAARTKRISAESENKLEKDHSNLNNENNDEKSSLKKNEKTEKQIIVNNPFYEGESRNLNYFDVSRLRYGSKLRSLSAKERMQMDLKHINLPDMLNTNACDEDDRRRAEFHDQMHKEWLETLSRQIQEKKEQKRIENERLARLDKVLECRQKKEFIPEKRAEPEKVTNFETAPRKISQSNKENGYDEYDIENNYYKFMIKNSEKSSNNTVNNRVYSYFRNSAGYKSYDKYSRPDLQEDSDEYSRESKTNESAKTVVNFGLNTLTIPRRSENVTISIGTDRTSRNECNHKIANNGVCQFCNNELKKYPEVHVQHRHQTLTENNVQSRKDSSTMTENRLLCTSCNKMYLICKTCKDVYSSCSYCKQNQNICHYCCGINYCTNCGKSIRGEQITITSKSDAKKQNIANFIQRSKTNSGKRNRKKLEPSFKILDEINCTENNESETKRTNAKYQESINESKIPSYPCSLTKHNLNGNINHYEIPIPLKTSPKNYSMNIKRNSLFHPENNNKEKVKTEKVKIYKEEKEDDIVWDNFKRTTNNKVVEYFDNYGDIYRKDSSKKISQTPRQRDDAPIIPFSIDSTRSRSRNREVEVTDKFVTLRKKWEVPAVQRQIISNNSPKVLTQLGAIRKQLQENEFGFD